MPHYSSPEPQLVSVMQPQGPFSLFIPSQDSSGLLASLLPRSHNPPPRCKGLPLAALALPFSHGPCLPSAVPAPQHLVLSLPSFRAWRRPPSPEVFSALFSQNYDHSQVFFYFSRTLPKQAWKGSRRAGGWRAIARGIVSSYRKGRPPPPALYALHVAQNEGHGLCAHGLNFPVLWFLVGERKGFTNIPNNH